MLLYLYYAALHIDIGRYVRKKRWILILILIKKLTARRVQRALEEWKSMREEGVAALDFQPKKQACGRKSKLSREVKATGR